MRHAKPLIGLGGAIALALALTPTASAISPDLDCTLDYSLDGWSVIYKRADGVGTVRCENGQMMDVRIKARGGGLTIGKSQIVGGRGEFSDVRDIDDVLGSYAQAEAHAGFIKSSSAQVLTKGPVSLALAGTGEGVDLGIDFGRFTIEPEYR